MRSHWTIAAIYQSMFHVLISRILMDKVPSSNSCVTKEHCIFEQEEITEGDLIEPSSSPPHCPQPFDAFHKAITRGIQFFSNILKFLLCSSYYIQLSSKTLDVLNQDLYSSNKPWHLKREPSFSNSRFRAGSNIPVKYLRVYFLT